MPNKGHSESTWVCTECEEEPIRTNINYSDIEVAGIPICRECGEDMEFVGEKWIEEVIV